MQRARSALERHWRRNASRLVKAVLVAGGEVTGRVLRVEGDAVVLDVDGAERVLPLAEVSRGLVQVEFDRPGVTLDEGPDDDEEEGP